MRRILDRYILREVAAAWVGVTVVLLVVLLMRSGRMTPARSRLIHRSVLLQMLAILFLAKGMFLL